MVNLGKETKWIKMHVFIHNNSSSRIGIFKIDIIHMDYIVFVIHITFGIFRPLQFNKCLKIL